MDSRDIILNNPDIQDLLDQFHGEKNRQKIIQWFIHRTRIDSIFHDEYRIFIGRPTRLPRDVPASGLEDVERYASMMSEVDIGRAMGVSLVDSLRFGSSAIRIEPGSVLAVDPDNIWSRMQDPSRIMFDPQAAARSRASEQGGEPLRDEFPWSR